jgi:putative acetyltransferase
MVQLKRTTSENPDFKNLVFMLDSDLNVRYGIIQAQYDKYNRIERIETVVLAYADEVPAGCGCYKKYNETNAEIKRMFILPEYRGRGIAQKILKELENWAKESGYGCTILETGIKQYEAINLYNKLGYKRMENYGPYIGNENSVCMIKWFEMDQ